MSEAPTVEIVNPLAERPSAVREIVVRNQDDLVFLKGLATAIAGSDLFRDGGRPISVEAVAVKVLVGQELGVGPISSMMNVNVINGRVSLSANLMAATIKRHRLYDYRVGEHTAEGCTVHFFERARTDEDFTEIGAATFTMADADAAELGWSQKFPPGGPRDPSSPWVKFPKAMVFARALSQGAKWYCPDVFYGLPVYVEGELDPEAVLSDEEAASYFHGTEAEAAEIVDAVAARKDTDAVVIDEPTFDQRQAVVSAKLAEMAADAKVVDVPASVLNPREANLERPITADDPDEAPDPDGLTPDELKATERQLKRLGVLSGQLSFTDEQRHSEAGVTSWNHLTKAEADRVIKDWQARLLATKGGRQA